MQQLFYGPPTDPIARIGNANFSELYSMYGLSIGSGGGRVYYVSPGGVDTNDGLSWSAPLLTVQAAIDKCGYYTGDVVVCGPGAYAESITVLATKGGLTIIGAGNRGDMGVSRANVRANDVTLVNVGVGAADADAYALRFTGDRFRAFGCKIEGAATSGAAILASCGTVLEIAAETDGSASDFLFTDCESAWTDKGFVCQSSDYGAVTQGRIRNHRFHNCTTVCLGEDDVSTIGSVRNLVVDSCIFDNAEDGTAPTDYINVSSTGCTGIITGCSFAFATNEADVMTIASGIMWVANMTEAGITTARPS